MNKSCGSKAGIVVYIASVSLAQWSLDGIGMIYWAGYHESEPSLLTVSSRPMPGISNRRMPGISNRRMPGISSRRMPGISSRRLPGISSSRMPGISSSRMSGISSSRMPDISSRDKNYVFVIYIALKGIFIR